MRRLFLLLLIPLLSSSCQTASRPGVSAGSGTQTAARSSTHGGPASAVIQVSAVTESYRLNPENTRIEFVGSGGGKSHQGNFQKFTGTIEWPANNPSPTRLALDIEMDSTTTNIFLLTRHLKSPDFFDVAKYPRASFVATRIEPGPAGNGTYLLTGEFTLHGVSQLLAIPATILLGQDALTLSSEFRIRQSDFGMSEAARRTNDEVPIKVTSRVPRK